MKIEDYMRLPKDRLAEILAQKDLEDKYAKRIYRGWTPEVPTIVSPQSPCYASDGVCSNPFHDCIGCPRQSVSGGYITEISLVVNN